MVAIRLQFLNPLPVIFFLNARAQKREDAKEFASSRSEIHKKVLLPDLQARII